jgi:hypothetical protein
LLEPIQGARRRRRLDTGEGRHRHEFSRRCFDLQIQQRIQGCPIFIADLGNDLVAAIEVVKAIDIGTAEQRAKLAPRRRKIEAEVRKSFAIDDHARLRQIDLEICVHIQELATLPACGEHLLRRVEQLLDRAVVLHDQFDVKLSRCRQGGI